MLAFHEMVQGDAMNVPIALAEPGETYGGVSKDDKLILIYNEPGRTTDVVTPPDIDSKKASS